MTPSLSAPRSEPRPPLRWRFVAPAVSALLALSLGGCGGGGGDGGGATTPPADTTTAGAFYLVQGLGYDAGSGVQTTGADGALRYTAGTPVKFSIGALSLGSAAGSARLTAASLVPEIGGDVKQITHQKVTNMARFIQSLDDDANIDNGIVISAAVAGTVGSYAGKINFDQTEAAFTADANVVALFSQISRNLVSGPQARNPLRRTMLGIRKFTDVQVPMRDGTRLNGNVWRPIDDGKYPVLVNVGAYGKEYSGFENNGCICNSADALLKAMQEDDYFQGKRQANTTPTYADNHENHETLNTVDWIPKGYIKVSVDDRGRCNSPGKFEQFSLQEAKDFYDSVEWAAALPYSNGNAGTWTVSYWSIVTMPMAAMQPPSLKAIIPLFTDVDTHSQVLFNGGLWNAFNFLAGKSCRTDTTQVDFPTIAKANPFYSDERYGTAGSLTIAADMSKIKIPMYTAIPLEHPAIHTKGSSEAFITAGTPVANKRLAVVEGDLWAWTYAKETVLEHIAFMDYWLKGKTDNGAMSGPPVKVKVRTGNNQFFWQEENEWPIARTEYRKLNLDARASSYGGTTERATAADRADFLQMPATAPTANASVSWAADIPAAGAACWNNGVSFVTEPMTEDVTLAGYLKLVTSVASTSRDMDLVVSVRVIDPSNAPITLAFSNFFASAQYPLGVGWLQVSKRKTDPVRSTVYRPVYTMTQADQQLLTPGTPVPVEVEIWPTTGRIVKGSRLRLDIQPVDGCGAPGTRFSPGKHDFDASYKAGHRNTLFTGPANPSYLQIPVIPAKS